MVLICLMLFSVLLIVELLKNWKAMASPVLEKILENPKRDRKTGEKVIPILGVPCESVSAFIRFLYTSRSLPLPLCLCLSLSLSLSLSQFPGYFGRLWRLLFFLDLVFFYEEERIVRNWRLDILDKNSDNGLMKAEMNV